MWIGLPTYGGAYGLNYAGRFSPTCDQEPVNRINCELSSGCVLVSSVERRTGEETCGLMSFVVCWEIVMEM